MAKFSLGQKVWVYNYPLVYEGEITEILDYGCRVKTDEPVANNRVRADHVIFARPADKNRLIAALLDDAHHAQVIAGKLEENDNRQLSHPGAQY